MQNDAEQLGMCSVAVAPIRIQADHRSEMVSQLLFGEMVTVKDAATKGWYQVMSKADGYTGWCQAAHISSCTAEEFQTSTNLLTGEWLNMVEYQSQQLHVPLGCSLPAIKNVKFTGKVWDVTQAEPNADSIKQVALQFLHTPYLWGGRSVFGIDCSGFTQAVYRFFNFPLLRDAHMQATMGTLVNFIQEAQCGDLAFFDDAEGKIIHVGLLLSHNKIIHSAGKVRIDPIDHQGIINADTGERTQHLRIIKRFFE